MVDGRHPTPGCLDPETLAAFVDGRLEPGERVAVETHLAECEDCYEMWMEVIQSVQETAVATRPSAARPAYGYRFLALAASLVLIASAFLLWSFVSPSAQLEGAVADLGRASAAWRPVAGRLSTPLDWTPAQTPTRSSGLNDPPTSVSAAAFRVRDLASRHRTPRGLHAEGIALILLGRFDEAVNILDEAWTLSPDSGHILLDLSSALLARATRTDNRADLVRALDTAERAAQRDPVDGRPLFNQAICLEQLGLLDRARRTWEAYLAVESDELWRAEARDRLNIVESKLKQQQPITSSEFNVDEDVLLVARQRPAGRNCLVQGVSHFRRAQTAVADRRWTDATRESDAAVREWSCAQVDGLPAEVLGTWTRFMSGDYQTAAEIAGRLAPRAESDGHDRWAARLRYVTGLWLISRAEISAGQADLERASRFAEHAGDSGLIGHITAALAEVLDEQGERSSAWQHLGNGLVTLSTYLPNEPGLDLMSTAAIAAGHAQWHGAAFHFADETIRLGTYLNQQSDAMLGRLQKGRALAFLDRPDESLSELAEASAVVSAMPEGMGQEAWRAEVGWIEGLTFRHRAPARAIEGLTASIDYFERVDRPFRLAELLLVRGDAHGANGDLTRAVQDLQRGASLLENQRIAIHTEQLRVRRSAEVWELFGRLIDLTTSDPGAALAIAERARSRELLEHIRPDSVAGSRSLVEIQGRLPDGAIVLEYVVRRDRLLRWTVTGGRIVLDELPVPSTLLAHYVAEARRELAAGRIGSAAGTLAELLIPANLPLHPDHLLVVIPDGPLNAVAFAALPLGDRGPLITHSFLTTAPSLRVFDAASQQAEVFRPTSALLVGVSLAHPKRGFAALPAVTTELDRISREYARYEVLADQAATAESLMRAMSSHSVIHFGGHATVNMDVPSRSALILWPDDASGQLHSEEIASAALQPGSVVVLAACDTAVGVPISGEGPLSLIRPFLGAGASAVVGSLWPIADAHASRVLTDFHASLSSGGSPMKALAVAQRRAIQAGVPPSGWAGFVMAGGAFR